MAVKNSLLICYNEWNKFKSKIKNILYPEKKIYPYCVLSNFQHWAWFTDTLGKGQKSLVSLGDHENEQAIFSPWWTNWVMWHH